jgi:uncharacterized membrane protein
MALRRRRTTGHSRDDDPLYADLYAEIERLHPKPSRWLDVLAVTMVLAIGLPLIGMGVWMIFNPGNGAGGILGIYCVFFGVVFLGAMASRP